MRGTGAEVKGLSARVVAYMAEMMDLHEVMTDQRQNQIARHIQQFAERERRRIRRSISPALRVMSGFNIPRSRWDAAVKAIDAATRPTKGRR